MAILSANKKLLLNKRSELISFGTSIKSAAKYRIHNLEAFEMLFRILWCRINDLFEDYSSQNGEVHMIN